ncbi:MAG: hypothetical protein ACRDNG_04195 [Gaiellaceae bacterium]
MPGETKPQLVLLFERLAEILELDEGATELRVQFDNGAVRRWWAQSGPHGHEQLRRYDDRAAHLLTERFPG